MAFHRESEAYEKMVASGKELYRVAGKYEETTLDAATANRFSRYARLRLSSAIQKYKTHGDLKLASALALRLRRMERPLQSWPYRNLFGNCLGYGEDAIVVLLTFFDVIASFGIAYSLLIRFGPSILAS
jgi:hypothetical protein